jgi:hypothetical protein
MKRRKQGYDDRLDESLAMKHRGAHEQSMEDRRDESKAMEKKDTGHAYAGDKEMDKAYHHHMAHAHHKYMAKKHRKMLHSK